MPRRNASVRAKHVGHGGVCTVTVAASRSLLCCNSAKANRFWPTTNSEVVSSTWSASATGGGTLGCRSRPLRKLGAASNHKEHEHDRTEDQGLLHCLYPWHDGQTSRHTHRTP